MKIKVNSVNEQNLKEITVKSNLPASLDKLEEMQNDPDHKFHGTRNGYKVGCRCDDCTDANSEYKKQYNLDKLEESDDEDEFENEREDRFVFLDREFNMLCSYNYKFKKWVPLKLADKNMKIVNFNDLSFTSL